MIENFLAPPRTAAEWTADALRLVGAASVIVTFVLFASTDAGILALALPALLAPRFIGLRGSADVAVGATVLVAAWSNVFDAYRRIPGWDLVVHFAATGTLALVAYLLLARLRVLPLPGSREHRTAIAVVISTALGLALSAVWEMIEWVGFTFISDDIFVAYGDTIGDLAAGGAGALLAGVILAFVPLLRSSSVRAELFTR
jgi:hypothetical protein